MAHLYAKVVLYITQFLYKWCTWNPLSLYAKRDCPVFRVFVWKRDTEEAHQKILFKTVHMLPGKEEKIERSGALQQTMRPRRRSGSWDEVKRASGYSVVQDLPPSVATLLFNILNERRPPSSELKKDYLVYPIEYPFVLLKKKTSSYSMCFWQTLMFQLLYWLKIKLSYKIY